MTYFHSDMCKGLEQCTGRKTGKKCEESLSVPIEHSAFTTDLLLKLNHAIHKSLGCWRETRDIDVNRNDAVTTTNNGLLNLDVFHVQKYEIMVKMQLKWLVMVCRREKEGRESFVRKNNGNNRLRWRSFPWRRH